MRVLVAGPTAFAFVGDFLAFGSEAAVRAAIDREQGAGERLAALPAYRRASDGWPDGRSLDAYASAAGVREVLGRGDGLLGALGALLDRPGLTAAGASLAAEERGLRARVRLVGGATGDAAFEPLLLERVPEAAAAYLGVRGALRVTRGLKRLGVERPVKQLRARDRRRARPRDQARPARAALRRGSRSRSPADRTIRGRPAEELPS